jgi:hypothetical protein
MPERQRHERIDTEKVIDLLKGSSNLDAVTDYEISLPSQDVDPCDVHGIELIYEQDDHWECHTYSYEEAARLVRPMMEAHYDDQWAFEKLRKSQPYDLQPDALVVQFTDPDQDLLVPSSNAEPSSMVHRVIHVLGGYIQKWVDFIDTYWYGSR